MSTRSIYHKACPSCAAVVEIEARQCSCGFSFDAQIEQSEPLTEDIAAQEEELLKEYLNARIAQAVAELQSMQAMLAADPKNMDKANRLMRTYVALHDLRAELGAQSAKADVAKDAALSARRERGWETDDAEKITSNEPGEAFRAGQAHKAEQIMQAAGMHTKTCPKCRTVMPEQSALCFCGFAFTASDADAPGTVTTQDAEASHKNL